MHTVMEEELITEELGVIHRYYMLEISGYIRRRSCLLGTYILSSIPTVGNWLIYNTIFTINKFKFRKRIHIQNLPIVL